MKTYEIELKPIFSAFKIKALGPTIVWTLSVNYPPLLETYLQHEENEGDEDVDKLIQLPIILLSPWSAQHDILSER